MNRSSEFLRLCTVISAGLGLLGSACGALGLRSGAPAVAPPAETPRGDTALAAKAQPRATDPARASEIAIARFKARRPATRSYFEQSYGYVVFPHVSKGGFWLGGAFGEGEVYERGRRVGRASVTAISAGPQLGGQAFSEVVFFADEAALRSFRATRYELGAEISAVAASRGTAKRRTYDEGVKVFTLPTQGLMAEAAVTGQRFCFVPLTAEGGLAQDARRP